CLDGARLLGSTRSSSNSNVSWSCARRTDRALDEPFRLPLDAELARRAHVAEQGRRGHDRWRGEVAKTAHAHAVRPVATDGGDGGLALSQRTGPLTEARTTPGLADLGTGRAEHVGDRLATETRIRALDVLPDAARAWEHDELRGRPRGALCAGRPQDQRRLEEV